MKYSVEMAEKLRKRLFDMERRDGRVYHYPKEDAPKSELAKWQIHGVCLRCHSLAISAGECRQCGQIP